MSNNKQILRCGGIIFNKNLDSVLVVLNKYSHLKGENKWGFPKGHRKPGEKIFNCAKREICEETGLELPNHLFRKRINIFNTIYYIIFLQEDFQEFKIPDTNEIAKVEWVKLNTLKNNNYNRDIRLFLEKNISNKNYDFCNKRLLKIKEPVKILFNNQIISY
jgi:8-oxo-dGTP pyrophosphatase MutT (NUDIX family)